MLQCIKCKKALSKLEMKSSKTKSYKCECGHIYKYKKNYIKYTYDQLLFETYKKEYLLNKVLNNNAYLSYLFEKEGSLSLANRSDVARFRLFINRYIKKDTEVVVDVGCGIMKEPGYLDYQLFKKNKIFVVGIDPIDSDNFEGLRIVGCSEYIPLMDKKADIAIFATSLDHVCSINRTLTEVNRILKVKGKVIIWMSDRSASIVEKAKNIIEDIKHIYIEGFSLNEYSVHLNNLIYYIPKGAVDPFHSFNETPDLIIKLAKKAKFKLVDITRNGKNEIFIALSK